MTTSWVKPWQVVLVAHLLYLGLILVRAGGDPLAFVRLGFGPNEGYDGQFVYLIATNPSPSAAVREIQDVREDVPAYRYQRILLPLLARITALGDPHWVPWTIPIVNLTAHTAGTAFVTVLLTRLGVSGWYALVYGLWVGLVLGVRADLVEPLSFALVAGGYVLHGSGRRWTSALCFGLAVFAKETAAVFVAAQLTSALATRDWKTITAQTTVAIAPFLAWQLALDAMFGRVGLGSGGHLATPFEIVPFRGVWRIASDSPTLFGVYLLFVGPWVMFPAIWGMAAAWRELRRGNHHPYVWALIISAAIIPFTPFSTFREPGGILRFSSGLVLSAVLFAAAVNSRAALRYSWLWLPMLVFLRE